MGQVITQLTAVGNSDGFDTSSNIYHTVAYTVASINTSVDVDVDGSLDGTNWFEIDSTQRTANGTYYVQATGKINYMRLWIVTGKHQHQQKC